MKNKFDDENDFQCCNKCDLPDTLQIVNGYVYGVVAYK